MKFLLLPLILFPLSIQAGTAEAKLSSPIMKNLSAKILLTEVQEGLKITADVTGLKPGSVHGFHIHEIGKCDGPDYKSAGDHFNPAGNKHGGPDSSTKHIGDLGNLIANEKGIAKAEVIVKSKDKNSLGHYVGKSVIIHARADDFATQPAGNSGDRIACGIISPEVRP